MLTKIIRMLIDVEGLGIEEWQEVVNFLTNQEKQINELKLDVERLKSTNLILKQQIDEENK